MREDILLDENYDLLEDGDEWLEGESDDLDVELIMLANKGENREFPFIGFGANKKLKGKFDKVKITREIEVELELDGFVKPQIIIGETMNDFKIIV
jgi:hypothetical protein